jgi:hypothetical protein
MLLVELQLLLLPVMCLSTAVTNVSGEFCAYKLLQILLLLQLLILLLLTELLLVLYC